MIRFGTVFWMLAVMLAAYATFQVKYQVVKLEEELGQINRQIVAERESDRVLNAEWSLLSDPQRLARLNQSFLHLAPVAAAQIERPDQLVQIPMKGAPASAAVPPQVARLPQ
jgi:cell division protein FtsL